MRKSASLTITHILWKRTIPRRNPGVVAYHDMRVNDGRLEDTVELGRQHDSKVFLAVVPFVDQLRNDYLVRDCDYVVQS